MLSSDLLEEMITCIIGIQMGKVQQLKRKKKSSNTDNLILAKVLIRALKMHEKGVKQLEKKSK